MEFTEKHFIIIYIFIIALTSPRFLLGYKDNYSVFLSIQENFPSLVQLMPAKQRSFRPYSSTTVETVNIFGRVLYLKNYVL